MSIPLNDDTIPFYLQGRSVKSLARLRKFVADPDEIVEAIEKGKPVRAAITDACAEAAKQLIADRKRKAAWLEEHNAELVDVTAIGGKDEAWKAYCYGMADELAYVYEVDVLDCLDDGDDDEDDEDDEEEGEGDDGDDDEDDTKKPS